MGERDRILVTGATGHVGREVVGGLARAGVLVRSVTREPGTARLPAGVEVVRGSQFDPAGLRRHLAGVEAVFLVWPDLGDLRAAEEAVAVIAAHADRVVFLSSAAVRDDLDEQENPIGRAHREIERAIERSGARWTFLRPWAFAANTLAEAASVRAGSVVRGAFGDVPVTLIDERDIAAVAVQALTDDRHAGQAYELTGPELRTPRERLDVIGEETGRRVAWEELPAEEWRRQQLQWGFSAEAADGLRKSFLDMRENPPPVTRTVEEVTGRPARTYRDWLRWRAVEFTDPLPHVRRPDADVVLISTWTLDTAERQRAAADAALAAWATAPWPEGLRQHSVLLGTDGRTLLHHSQWSSEEAVDEFTRTDPPERVRGIDAAVPGIERSGVTTYRLHRSVLADPGLRPGCIVLVSFRTDDRETAESFVETLLERYHPVADPARGSTAGMASNHFHIALDGTAVVNYAEFVDEEAHRAIVDTQLRADDPVPRMIAEHPGLTPLGFRRFLPYRAAVAPPSLRPAARAARAPSPLP
jgi:uncharacterized protein YbjT (DUF2867 family)/heme-degrading monooxygenase HmoA